MGSGAQAGSLRLPSRQRPDFGELASYETTGAEYFSLGAGTDMAPLLAGLEHDLCHSPHWGLGYSWRMTVMGSTEVARRLGRSTAAMVISPRMAAAATRLG